MLLGDLSKKGLIQVEPFILSNTQYLAIVGSTAHGVADTSVRSKPSDWDIQGFCIPPKDYIFPHLRNEILNFGTRGPNFHEYEKHHVFDKEAQNGVGRQYDLKIYSIVKYFDLGLSGNPNILDSLFTPEECVIHGTIAGRMVRDNRKLFVSKLVWNSFRGYAFGQLKKMTDRKAKGARVEIIERYGYDCKFASHVIRALDEGQQLMETGEMNIQRAKEVMKSIRRGEWKLEEIIDWAKNKANELDIAFTNCKLPERPDEEEVKKLLIRCIEEHYGSLSNVLHQPDWSMRALRELDDVLGKYRGKMYGERSKPWWKFW